MSRPNLHGPEIVALLAEVVALVGTAMRVPGAKGLEVQWYVDEDDGNAVDVAVRNVCGCTHTVTHLLDRGSERAHRVIHCVKHAPAKVVTRWPEGLPW